MPIKFNPNYTITPRIAHDLMRIEAAKQHAQLLPITPTVLASLRESARLYTTHYSTMIEGNRLSSQEIEKVLKHKGHFPGKERDEREVMGYYAALTHIEQLAAKNSPLSEKIIQTVHNIVMSAGKSKAKPDKYRDGQNAIRDGRTGALVYLPPEAKDVPKLMKSFVDWINRNNNIPCPIRASIAHYQFATIHPYFDGNGRTARLITTMILHLGGYDLKGLYALEEYYARNLEAYYNAISVGSSHNYYLGREDADITQWIEYFIEGMAVAFENVLKKMNMPQYRSLPDQSNLIRTLDPRQRKVLQLFEEYETITAKQVGVLFGVKARTSAKLCKDWTDSGFLEIVDPSNKSRSYRLAKKIKWSIS